MPYSLTPAMADCARVIAELTALEGRPPSYDQIAAELCLNKSRVKDLVYALEERGWLERRGWDRCWHLTREPPPLDVTPVEVTEAGRAHLEAAA